MDKADILSAALKLEEDGKGFYLSIAEKAPNEYAKKTFESFAADEENHIKWIRGLSEGPAEFESSSEALEKIYSTLQGIFSGIPEDMKGKLAAAPDDASQIDIAIGKEEESIKAYIEWAGSAEDEEVKDLFAVLVEIEKTHRDLLNNAKTYLNNTGDWFMTQEQWSFDGA